jgi:hypothetical protein
MLPHLHLEYLRILRCHEAGSPNRMPVDMVSYRTRPRCGSGEFALLYRIFEAGRVCVPVKVRILTIQIRTLYVLPSLARLYILRRS